jgi:hypothetical protein
MEEIIIFLSVKWKFSFGFPLTDMEQKERRPRNAVGEIDAIYMQSGQCSGHTFPTNPLHIAFILFLFLLFLLMREMKSLSLAFSCPSILTVYSGIESLPP